MKAQSNNSCPELDHLLSSERSCLDLDRPQAGPAPTLRASTPWVALFSNFALKYAAVLNSQVLSAGCLRAEMQGVFDFS